MERRLPVLLLVAMATLLLIALGVALVLRLPARTSLPGLPAPITTQVGALPDEYASAVSTHLLDLLLTWTQENRLTRLKAAGRLMSGPALTRYITWARSGDLALRTLQIEQRAKLRPIAVKRIGPDTYTSDVAVDLQRYVGGLGGETQHFTFRLMLRRIDEPGIHPASLCVIGLRAEQEAVDHRDLPTPASVPNADAPAVSAPIVNASFAEPSKASL